MRLHSRPDRRPGSAADPDAQHPNRGRRSCDRTELAPDGYNILWTPGDRIGIYVKSGDTFTTVNAPLTFEGAQAASEGTFAGDITLAAGASGYTLYAYYPYSEQASDDAFGHCIHPCPAADADCGGRLVASGRHGLPCRRGGAESDGRLQGRWHSATPLRSWRST